MRKSVEKFEKLEVSRRALFAVLLADTAFIEGNISEILVRCGRTGCHCEKQPAHHVTRLGVREDGKIKNKVVRVNDRDKVRELVLSYKAFKKAQGELEKLERKEKILIRRIRKLRHWRYE